MCVTLALRMFAQAQEELLVLLACGAASPGLRHFLCSTLCEGGVRRLAKPVDAAATAVHNTLADKVRLPRLMGPS
eukprot:8614458-Pyramimonas_sp.AAC.1